MGNYKLVCISGGETVVDECSLSCKLGHNSLLRSVYDKKYISIKPYGGVFKFYDWLPVHSVIKTEAAPVVFRSDKISNELGLENLWIGFTGYYPERGCKVISCTFKEMESLPTYARLNDHGGGTIVLASAGNTARAFAQTALETGNRCIIVIPKSSEGRVTITEYDDYTNNVRLFTVDGDYADAIHMSDRIVGLGGFVSEGGAKNVARRDGMGTVMIEGTMKIGRIPDHYFQAVGSGTGGISAWEASMRLIGDGRFGNKLPTLNLSQNSPFTPMSKAWNDGHRMILDKDLGDPIVDITKVYADVLTNRNPPYSIAGGVFDAMMDCNGHFYEVSNDEAISAEKLWMSIENVRPDPAASVALASLIQAIDKKQVKSNQTIFLNMTGGGMDRVNEDYNMINVHPESNIPLDVSDDDLRRLICV